MCLQGVMARSAGRSLGASLGAARREEKRNRMSECARQVN